LGELFGFVVQPSGFKKDECMYDDYDYCFLWLFASKKATKTGSWSWAVLTASFTKALSGTENNSF
jgi:hypothetical protein